MLPSPPLLRHNRILKVKKATPPHCRSFPWHSMIWEQAGRCPQIPAQESPPFYASEKVEKYYLTHCESFVFILGNDELFYIKSFKYLFKNRKLLIYLIIKEVHKLPWVSHGPSYFWGVGGRNGGGRQQLLGKSQFRKFFFPKHTRESRAVSKFQA